jgi:hypothetical protein
VVEQWFQFSSEQGVNVPELIILDYTGVIGGFEEIRFVFLEKIGDVVEVNEPIQSFALNTVFLAGFLTDEPGGFVQVVPELCVLGHAFRLVMIEDGIIGLIHPRFKCQVTDPCRLFAELAVFPFIIMVSFQPGRLAKQFFGQSLQQQSGYKSVQVAFMSANYVRLYQQSHRTD